jgi:NADPH:quinone reductase-like Zn-dependent oxidoreductase
MGLVIGFKKPKKSILGIVFSGEVESVGDDVKSFKIGDKVYGFDRFGFGTYAEYKCISDNGLVVKKPISITYIESVAMPFGWLLALYFLRRSNIHSGQNVLIYGASGAVGTAAVQLSIYFGAKVTGVCSTTNLELVKSLGADNVIDYTKENFTLNDNKYDLIFNAVGKRKAKLKCKDSLTRNGKHITVDDGSPKFHIDDLILLNDLIESKQFKAVIDRTYPLEQIVQAHRYVDEGHKKGNVIITVD